MQLYHGIRADSRLAPSQWETSLQCNAVPHWLGTNLESSLGMMVAHDMRLTFSEDNSSWHTWLPQPPCRRNRSRNTCYSLRDDLGVWREKCQNCWLLWATRNRLRGKWAKFTSYLSVEQLLIWRTRLPIFSWMYAQGNLHWRMGNNHTLASKTIKQQDFLKWC